MKPRPRLWNTLTWLTVAALLAAIVATAVQDRWLGSIVLSVFTAIILFLLLGKERVPPLFTFLFAVMGLLNGSGYIWNLFTQPGPFDELSHLYTSFTVSLTLAYAIFGSVRRHFRNHQLLFIWIVTSFGTTVGVAWEVFEWLIQIINGLQDTLMDLVMDALGALMAGFAAVLALRSEYPPEE